MGMRGPWAHPMPGFRAAPRPSRKHRYRCRECREIFTCIRDDRRFCSGACRIRNFRRRGAVSAVMAETFYALSNKASSERFKLGLRKAGLLD
jgi:hypothetical protein